MKWHYIFSSPNKYSLTSTTVSMLWLKVSIPDSHCSSARSITCYHGPCDLLVLNALSLISLFRHTEISMWGCHMCQQQAFIYAKIFTLWDLSDWNAFFFLPFFFFFTFEPSFWFHLSNIVSGHFSSVSSMRTMHLFFLTSLPYEVYMSDFLNAQY